MSYCKRRKIALDGSHNVHGCKLLKLENHLLCTIENELLQKSKGAVLLTKQLQKNARQ